VRRLSENYKEINILILGSGNQEIENHLNSLLVDYKGITTRLLSTTKN
jgi:starch synthase